MLRANLGTNTASRAKGRVDPHLIILQVKCRAPEIIEAIFVVLATIAHIKGLAHMFF